MPHNPILISSAVRRSGTTLIQRLLCSASNALIYGETCAYDLQFFLHVYLSKQLNMTPNKVQRNELTQKVLAGDVNDWITDLMPPVDDYLQAMWNNCFSMLDHFRDYAKQNNRSVWGLKMAEWQAGQLLQVQRFFPEAKLVYIHRSLPECARSACQLSMIQNLQELEHFCQTWQQNYQQITSNFPSEQLLLIDYQELLDQPKLIIAQLENFTGARGIRQEVMDKRINTYKFDPRQVAEGEGYIAPIALTDAQQSIVEKYASIPLDQPLDQPVDQSPPIR